MSDEQFRLVTHATEPKGWMVVEPVVTSHRLTPVTGLDRTPVIGWLIESLEIDVSGSLSYQHEVIPITIFPKSSVYVLQSPDGRFHTEAIGLDSEADVIDYFEGERVREAKALSRS